MQSRQHMQTYNESEVKIPNHYKNTPIQINWKFYHQKNENFRIKIYFFFSIFLLKT